MSQRMARYPLPPAEPVVLTTLAEIAKGGMGSVEMAAAKGGRIDGRVVAVKRLNQEVAQDPQFVNMFLDEAWMTSAIHSPHVIRAEAWGQDDRGMFLAVELVQGVSLSRLLKESRANEEPFAERTVANVCSQICAGLVAAHSLVGPDGAPLGLVHRDLTPGNILVGFDGIVKIADFGIAQAEERLTRTRTGMMKGKPAYMAPEQARGGRVDARADIFSIGVMMFELLSGKRPWAGKSAFDVLMDVATKPPPSLAELRKNVNPMYVEIVDRCLQKKPEQRFASAAEIKTRLDAWRSEKGFDRDDQQSMSTFVQRNTPRQMQWFRDALKGAPSPEAPTFKDLEEKIDEQRAAETPGGPRPAAGRRASSHLMPAVGGYSQPPSGQMQQVQPATHGHPSNAPAQAAHAYPQPYAPAPQPAASGAAPGSIPANTTAAMTPQQAGQAQSPYPQPPAGRSAQGSELLGPASNALSSTRLMQPSDHPSAASAAPARSPDARRFAGTEFMAQSPFLSAPAASAPPPAAAPDAGAYVGASAAPSPPQTSSSGVHDIALPPRRGGRADPNIVSAGGARPANDLPLPPRGPTSSQRPELMEAANAQRAAARAPVGPAQVPPPPASSPHAAGAIAAPPPSPSSGGSGKWVVVAIVVMLLLGGVGFAYWRWGAALLAGEAAGSTPAEEE